MHNDQPKTFCKIRCSLQVRLRKKLQKKGVPISNLHRNIVNRVQIFVKLRLYI